MKNQKSYWILYLISATILTTIVIQFYWNYNNYQQNKQRVLNEIQLSLDDAVEIYYSNLTKSNFLTIVKSKKKRSLNVTNINFKSKDSVGFDEVIKITDALKEKDSTPFTQFSKNERIGWHYQNGKVNSVKIYRGKKASDSLKLIKGLKTIFVSIKTDTLAHKKFDSILKKQLDNRDIKIDYIVHFFKNDSLKKNFASTKTSFINVYNEALAKSTFLGTDKKLILKYTNPSKEALKRSSTGILLSLLLSLAVISSLFYLLKIINKQKQLATIKNDLISNITHEFKTPITTVSTALEAINSFNVINDKQKTQTYIDISKNQIEKLHVMVEKLLETATLDSENLLLKKQETNLVILVEKLIRKHQLITSKKEITLNCPTTSIISNIDAFHFENAVSNLIDNSIKYGGNTIEIALSTNKNRIFLEVIDNGKGIEKGKQDKVFDKFYRVPTGNTHDIKGYGIGLYYTKKIIEKHGGEIKLKSENNHTIFTISFTND